MKKSKGIDKLRKILEDYTEWLPQEYWPIFNYISLEELEYIQKVRNLEMDLFKRLYDAGMYWVKLGLPDSDFIEGASIKLRWGMDEESIFNPVEEAKKLSKYMLMEIISYGK